MIFLKIFLRYCIPCGNIGEKERIIMKKLLYKLQARFLTRFGNIKVFKWPFFIVYDPTVFSMPGEKIMQVRDMLKPGDLILRGFSMYLDGMFVPGDYSHGAIYVGNDTIIHAVAEGVSKINVIDFCECDRICIVRPKSGQEQAIKRALDFVESDVPYDFGFKRGASALYCFELCAECYKELGVKPIKKSALWGLIKKRVFLAESFQNSESFERVFEFNPKRNVDFVAEEEVA